MLVWALIACLGEPRLNVAQPACQAEYLSWAGGLTEYIDAGGGHGDFDLDPAGPLATRAFGNYELSSGDFVYTVEYEPRHWRASTRVEGYGYAASNGDLDTEAVWKTTDVRDQQSSIMKREIRTGCTVESTQLNIYGQEWVTEGHFIASEFDYTRKGPLYDFTTPGEYTGVWKSDLTLTESVQVNSDGVDYTEDATDDGEGNSRQDWVWDDATTYQAGFDAYDVAGTWTSHIESSADQDCTIDREVEYDGNGGGSIDCGSDGSCDLTYTNWICTRECSDGSSGNCWASTSYASATPKIHRLPKGRSR